MKKRFLPTLALLLIIAVSGYLVSDYALDRVGNRLILQYKILAVMNGAQDVRYDLLSLHEELLSQSLQESESQAKSVRGRIQHVRQEMQNMNILLSKLQEDDEVLKRYTLMLDPMERSFRVLAEKTELAISENDPDKRKLLLTEAIDFSTKIREILDTMDEEMDEEGRSAAEKIAEVPAELQHYQVAFLVAVAILFLFSIVMFLNYKHRLLGQILQMTRQIAQSGNSEERLPNTEYDRALQEIAAELSALMENVEKKEKKLGQLTIVDPLTGLHNRRYFQERLQEEFKRFIRYNTLFSIAIVDVDHFKRINDTYGHQQGDEVLKEIAQILRSRTRETDILARYGGEEFVIIYTCTEKGGAFLHIDRVRQAISEHTFPGLDQKITISAGISDTTGKISTDEVIGDSDTALYQAKSSGRNRCQVHYSPLGGASIGGGDETDKGKKNVSVPASPIS